MSAIVLPGTTTCTMRSFNVVAMVTGTTSFNVIERYHYSPYGEVTILNGPSDLVDGTGEWTLDADQVSDIGNEFLCTGRRLDPETGLYQYRFRYYHAQMGRFLTRDITGYEAGLNLYAYVGGMPTYYVDPLGLEERKGDEYGPYWWNDGPWDNWNPCAYMACFGNSLVEWGHEVDD